MNEHKCTKVEEITKHGEAIKYIIKQIYELSEGKKDMASKIEVLESTSSVNKALFDNFMVEYQKNAPEAKKSIQKIIYFLISSVLMVVLALGGFMAYQNNVIVKLQDENKKLILQVIKPSAIEKNTQ